MNYLFIEYPKCSTCQKAKKWLLDHHVSFTDRHIVEDTPTSIELKEWIQKSGKPIKSFFNTSGLVYKNLNLKETLPSLSEEEQLFLLSSNGMLLKRPILVSSDFVLIGFKEMEWKETLNI